ncbi:MAG: hypothetical protein JXA71_00540, partial [Chitinispirillaceae bacterium]|nr:hypothetical protein [Chitinispirillaceae bacterium]
NNPRQYELWCQIGGNIVNRGTWINAQNTLTDSIAQEVRLDKRCTIGAPFLFDGMWPEGPYVWQKDGNALGGDSLRLLRLDSLSAASQGIYRCGRDTAWSRFITVLWDTTVSIGDKRKRMGGTPPAIGCAIASGMVPAVRFWTPYACGYSLSVYDIRGRLVAAGTSQVSSGFHLIAVPRQGLAAGTYTIAFRAAHFEKAMRFAIAR